MKFLHTADWHVGKVLKGRSRTHEHAAVLAELVGLAQAEDVDAAIIAGDVFDTAAPTPESQALVMHTLLALRQDHREVVVLAGNHDNPRLLDVYRPVLGALGIHVLGTFRPPQDGGRLAFTARSGAPVQVAALPFLSHRYAVRAAEALTGSPHDHNRAYAKRITELLGALTASFRADTVNLVVTHGTLPDGKFGGGEREAQSILPYCLAPTAFPPSTHYAALGHLHRRQQVRGPCPIWYAGSPIAVDFGEEDNHPGALVVTVQPDRPPVVVEHQFASARRLRTVRGNLEQLEAAAGSLADAWLRVIVAEKPHAGLAQTVRGLLPGALEVDLDARFRPTPTGQRHRGDQPGRTRSPGVLFREYLGATGHQDQQVAALFDQLYDEVTTDPAPAADAAGVAEGGGR